MILLKCKSSSDADDVFFLWMCDIVMITLGHVYDV